MRENLSLLEAARVLCMPIGKLRDELGKSDCTYGICVKGKWGNLYYINRKMALQYAQEHYGRNLEDMDGGRGET